ncbi:hypothetical protein [Nocardia sp. NRRL S-836]|uniref:hypothetical protein n=1 Tax=Nocardia sp. NRRL S-836 TaxID=1519492 RepID=UPI0006B0560E|nr:hypothetical protein [Nocardia sp. NRRL S-836]KOV79282.1 hypothetical protein ADL03_37440 [Nocardia sp. NRRL S-836]
MTTATRLFSYPEQRALEDAAFARATTPTRIFKLLFPIWCVTIAATVTDAEDYDLIDRYLERGIAEGGFTTAAELARFFALDEVLVDRALRALAAIGHVTCANGRWALTALGRRSTAAQKRYVIRAEDRRKLYFDAWESRPLARPHYDSRKVTMLPLHARPDHFEPLVSTRGFDDGALHRLAGLADRDRFNLPAQIDQPRQVCAPELLYLPVYVVRATEGRHVRYLVYGQASDEADRDLTALAEGVQEVAGVLETEQRSARDPQSQAHDWLNQANLTGRVARTGEGLLRVTLRGDAFGGDRGLPLHRLGSFTVRGTGFFQLWCQDERVRERALAERLASYVLARSQVARAQVENQLARLGRQLGFTGLTVEAAAALARRLGNQRLAKQLSKLT